MNLFLLSQTHRSSLAGCRFPAGSMDSYVLLRTQYVTRESLEQPATLSSGDMCTYTHNHTPTWGDRATSRVMLNLKAHWHAHTVLTLGDLFMQQRRRQKWSSVVEKYLVYRLNGKVVAVTDQRQMLQAQVYINSILILTTCPEWVCTNP